MIDNDEAPYSPVDPNAPRYREKVHDIVFIRSVINTRDNSGGEYINGELHWIKQGGQWFEKLKEKYPQLKKYKNLQIKNFIKKFNWSLVDSIIEHRDGVMLPIKMGTMMIATMGKRTWALDRKRSNDEGYRIYHRNAHSERYGGGAYWTAEWSNEYSRYVKNSFPNHSLWYFEPNTQFRYKIGNAYRTDWKRYWVLTNTRRVDDICYSYKKLNKAKRLQKVTLKNYNEFDFD